jgi:GPH family glycoside/pentoside/hexuronide:cation symporter
MRAAEARVGTPCVARGGLLAHAALGMPLAMMALPVYVLVPRFYADATGLALATIGALLLGTRLLDAFADPLLGAWVDAQRRSGDYVRPIVLACAPLALGFALLFTPPAGWTTGAAALWLALTLAASYLGYSLASIAYQSWGSELARDDAGRTRITAAREGAGLAGVVLAAALPQALGVPALVALFLAALALALFLLLRHSPRPAPGTGARERHRLAGIAAPLGTPRFRWLLAVFVGNGIAAAIPATLVLFFIADRLQLEGRSGLFLALYFFAGAASMPLWVRAAARFGLHAAWLAGMVAAVAAFVWAYALDAGDLAAYAAICVLSGAALGADLALPPALLARVIDANGHRGAHEGAYFGLWNFVNKLNLALAAGFALPLLGAIGYAPGSRDPDALQALSFTYAVVPCLLKLGAAALLLVAWRGRRF